MIRPHSLFLARSVKFFTDRGLNMKFIELSNEPDGGLSGYISPQSFYNLAASTRASLDALGLHSVGIVGPGTTALASFPFSSLMDLLISRTEPGTSHSYMDVLGSRNEATPPHLSSPPCPFFSHSAPRCAHDHLCASLPTVPIVAFVCCPGHLCSFLEGSGWLVITCMGSRNE